MKKKLLSKEQMRDFIKENNLTTAADAQAALKDLFGEMLQHMLEAELDNELGYSRYDYKNKNTDNSVMAIAKESANRTWWHRY